MNLRELEYLVAIDEERHFNRAAERCFVSQPTLSGQLRKLEQELGVRLVERTTRQVVMTEAGRAIADQARKALMNVREMRVLAEVFEDPLRGEIQLGVIPTLGPYLLPHILPALNQAYPRLKFWLHEYQTHVLLEKLRRGELDLLILALPVEHKGFVEIELFAESFRLAVPGISKLARRHSVTVDDILGQEMLLLEEGHCLREQALEVCFMAGASENSGYRAASLETLRQMVGENMGMTLIPELAITQAGIEDKRIRYIPFESPRPSRSIGMLYRTGSHRQAAFEKVEELVKSVISRRLNLAADELPPS